VAGCTLNLNAGSSGNKNNLAGAVTVGGTLSVAQPIVFGSTVGIDAAAALLDLNADTNFNGDVTIAATTGGKLQAIRSSTTIDFLATKTLPKTGGGAIDINPSGAATAGAQTKLTSTTGTWVIDLRTGAGLATFNDIAVHNSDVAATSTVNPDGTSGTGTAN